MLIIDSLSHLTDWAFEHRKVWQFIFSIFPQPGHKTRPNALTFPNEALVAFLATDYPQISEITDDFVNFTAGFFTFTENSRFFSFCMLSVEFDHRISPLCQDCFSPKYRSFFAAPTHVLRKLPNFSACTTLRKFFGGYGQYSAAGNFSPSTLTWNFPNSHPGSAGGRGVRDGFHFWVGVADNWNSENSGVRVSSLRSIPQTTALTI